MPISITTKVGVKLNLGNPEIKLYEGDKVTGLTYMSGNTVKTIDGAVRVIQAVTKANSTVPTTCPPEPYVHKYVTPNALIIDTSEQYKAVLVPIDITNIIAIGAVNGVGNAATIGDKTYGTLEEAIASAEPGADIVFTQPAVVNQILTVTNSVNLDGNGNAIRYGGDTLANMALITVSGKEDVTIKHMTVETNKLVKHGIQLYSANNAVVEDVLVNGGPYTAILVNSSQNVLIKDCSLTASSEAYCCLEYAIGANVEEIPSITLENVKFDSKLVSIWADSATFEKVRTKLGGADVQNDAVIEAIKNSITNKSGNDITMRIGITADDTVDIIIPKQ